MSIEWSSSGLDIHLDWTGGRGLADAVRTAIQDGRLAAGTRMPSTRALAADLGIARGTVTRAYADLVAEGYLRSRQGAPTTVAALPRQKPAASVTRPAESPATRWNLMPGRPDLTMFPRTDWLAAARRAVHGMAATDLGYGAQQGHPALRTALADYLGRVRGVVCSAEQVMVCAGYGQALGLLATVLKDTGATTIAFENPSLAECHRIVEAAGLTPVGVPVDEHGIRVDLLARQLDGPARPAAVVVTPAHHYPLGGTLHPHRRAELLALARVTNTLIIEDDYDGEFRFDRQPVGALQAMAPDLVAYAGTASKTLAPGLRLGWLVLPDRLLPGVRTAKFFADRHNSVLEQLTFAELIRSGHYDQHVRRCRTHYRKRRDTVVAMITDLGGTLTPAGIAAGLHVVVLVGDEAREAEIMARAARRSVLVETLGRGWLTPGPRPGGIVVGYAAPPEHAFAPALQALAEALAV